MYRYLGDWFTDKALKGATCEAIRREDGKCIRSKSKMLVMFGNTRHVVLGRLLRKIK